MKCKFSAYQGDEPYIFVSYCHKDSEKVYPYIEKLNEAGYRVWYDDGIIAGSEWPEEIARKLEGASVFVAFISEAAVDSHNCRKEINHAVDKEKKLAVVFLEKAKLTPGMEMQISDIQSIKQYEEKDVAASYSKLIAGDMFDVCNCGKNTSVEDKIEEDVNKKDKNLDTPEEGKKDLPKDSVDSKVNNDGDDNANDDMTVLAKPDIDLYFEYTDVSGKQKEESEAVSIGEDATVRMDELRVTLTRLSTGEEIAVKGEAFKIGKSVERTDYRIDSPIVSREHAKIIVAGNKCFVEDLKSTNHTFLNDKDIEPGKPFELSDGDRIRFAAEEFKICIIKKDVAPEPEPVKSYGTLRFVFKDGREAKEISEASFKVGRTGDKADIVITDDKDVGRHHANFYIDHENGKVAIQDAGSINGTYINGKRLDPYNPCELNNGDTVHFADVSLHFHNKFDRSEKRRDDDR